MSEPLLLGIAGSPRRGGNSDRLLDVCLGAAAERGVLVERLIVSSAGVGCCRGCNACSATGVCIQRDGMDDVARVIESADGIVIASPVYFAGVPGSLKALIDRLQPFWARRYVLRRPVARRRPGGIILAGGGGDPYGTAGAEATLRSGLAVLGVDVLASVVVTDVDVPGDVNAHPQALAQASDLGSEVARAMLARAAER